MIFMKGFIPSRIRAFHGISGSNLSGVKKRTNKTSSGKRLSTNVSPQMVTGISILTWIIFLIADGYPVSELKRPGFRKYT